jgi:hypothetical protein
MQLTDQSNILFVKKLGFVDKFNNLFRKTDLTQDLLKNSYLLRCT